MSHFLAITLPLPVLLALVASLLVSLAVASVVLAMRRPMPVRLPARPQGGSADSAAVADRD